MTPFIGVNRQAEQPSAGLPELAIVHDDFSDPLKPFQGADVRLWRPMSQASSIYTALPVRAPCTYDNEDDHEDRSWRMPYVRHLRQFRPDLYLVCPAEKPTERDQYNPDEIALCDAIGVHIAVYEDPSAWADLLQYGKPIWILEVEADQANPEQMGQLVSAAEAHIAAGAACAFLWGSDPFRADVNDRPDILAQVRAYNSNGGTMPADEAKQDSEIATNFAQVTDLTEALKRLRQGKFEGPEGIDAMIVALQGGQPLDFTPTWPPKA